MKLSILIASIKEREKHLHYLLNAFNQQIKNYDDVEIRVLSDNKELSIGKKRQKLLEMANGEYIVFFDDDDSPKHYYVEEIMKALTTNPDSVGFKIQMYTNGEKPQMCCHSFKYKKWLDNIDGFDYVRTITHFNPVKRALALKAGFKDLRFGEDIDYSMRLMKLIKNEVFIDSVLFDYNYSNKIPHKKKYGIK